MKDWNAKWIKGNIAELLKHYILDMNESKAFDEDNYSEIDEIVDKIDKLIKSRIEDAIKEHSADSAAHNN